MKRARFTVKLPEKLIIKAFEEGWGRQLATFVELKTLFKNNIHYNTTLRTLASYIERSHGSLASHLRKLKDEGLVYTHSGNMCFMGFEKMQEIYGGHPKVVPFSRHNQFEILRGQIIRLNLNKQKYRLRKTEHKNRRKGELVPYTFREKSHSSYTGLSCLGVGKLFNLSRSSGQRIIGKLSKYKQLEVDKVFSMLYKYVTYQMFLDLRNNFIIPSYAFFKKGAIYVQRRSQLVYLGTTLHPNT